MEPIGRLKRLRRSASSAWRSNLQRNPSGRARRARSLLIATSAHASSRAKSSLRRQLPLVNVGTGSSSPGGCDPHGEFELTKFDAKSASRETSKSFETGAE